MIHYILQVVLFQLLFLVVYDLFLKRETFFNYNRLYLLVTSVLGFVLPFIKLDIIQQQIPQAYQIQLPAVLIGNPPSDGMGTASITLDAVVFSNQGFSTSEIALWVYALGVLIALLLFVFKLRKIYRLKQTATLQKMEGLTLAILPNTEKAFTFMNTIFLGANLSERQQSHIIQHEMVHAKQRHTLDLLFFELLKVVCWFNPMVYLFQEKLRTLHEFTADRLVAATNKSAYYQTLLSEVFGTTTISFVNTFYKSSLIKKRIVMLQKSNSKKIVQLKYLLLVPAICAMLFYTSCSEETESNNSEPNLAQYTYSLNMGEEMSKETEATHNAYESFLKANNEKYVAWVTHEEDVLTYSVHKRSEKVPATLSGPMKFDFQDGTSYDAYMQWPEGTRSETKISGSEFEIKDEWPTNSDEVPFAVIEKVPAYPGCEGSNEEVKKCTSKFIQTFVGENFNKNLANEVDLTGRQRISVQFKIDSEGYVGNVKARAAHPDLEAEAIRVVSKLPQMEPGESKGKKVSVIYSLPIIFQIDE